MSRVWAECIFDGRFVWNTWSLFVLPLMMNGIHLMITRGLWVCKEREVVDDVDESNSFKVTFASLSLVVVVRMVSSS